MFLVTLQEAKTHLRVDDCDVNVESDISMKMEAASDRVIDYIDQGIVKYQNTAGNFIDEDSAGNWLAPNPVKAAVLLLLGYLWNQRDQDAAKEFDGGELPRPVRSMLRTYRKTVVA